MNPGAARGPHKNRWAWQNRSRATEAVLKRGESPTDPHGFVRPSAGGNRSCWYWSLFPGSAWPVGAPVCPATGRGQGSSPDGALSLLRLLSFWAVASTRVEKGGEGERGLSRALGSRGVGTQVMAWESCIHTPVASLGPWAVQALCVIASGLGRCRFQSCAPGHAFSSCSGRWRGGVQTL